MADRNQTEGPAPAAAVRQLALAAAGIAQLAADGRWLSVNPALCRLAGRSEAELLERDSAEVCHPDDAAAWCAALRRLLTGEAPALQMELRWLLPGEGSRRVGCSVVPAPAAVGEATAAVLTAVDIGPRVAAREAHGNCERRFHSLSTALAEIVWRADPEGRSARYEQLPTWEQFTGLDTGEVAGMDWLGVIHPDDRARATAAWRQAVANQQPYYVEYRLRRHDGAWRTMAVRGVPVIGAGGAVLEWVGVCVDITEQRRSEREISQLNEQLQQLVNVVQRLTGARTLEALAGIVCSAACLLTGCDGAAFALREGERLHYIRETGTVPQFEGRQLTLEQCLGGAAVRGGKLVLCADLAFEQRPELDVYRSTPVHAVAAVPVGALDPLGALVLYWARPLQPDARALQMLHTLADAAAIALENVHHYALLETRVAERTAQLQAASRAKSQFLSSMSHELRTPLNAVLGFAQLLEAESDQQPHLREYIGHIQRAGWHLLTLINEVLDLARIETGAMRMSMESVDLRELVAETLLLIGPGAAERHIDIRQRGEAGSAWVLADRTRLRQILLNLLTNAVKYNREGGSVTLSWRAVDGERLRIAVEDTGPGLSETQREHLFEAFNRLGREAENIEGTGIGLVITKRLVEAMGGTIGVSSEPGRGSTFWIELRAVAEGPAEEPAVPVSPPPQLTRPYTLLYIEDNPVNLLLVGKLLEAQPLLHMLSANNGAIGLDMARTYRPDLIVLDIGLPDISGIEVLRELAGDQRTRAIPVLAVSAHAAHSDIEQALAAGARRYITKPIRLQELLDAVYRCLE